MRQSRKGFFGTMTAAALAVALIANGSTVNAFADVEMVAPNPMVANPAVPSQGQGAAQASGGQTQSVTVVEQISPVSASGGSAGTSQSSDKNGVITAGSNSPKGVISSAVNLITTEGEKGNPQYQPILGGASLTMVSSSNGAQMLSMILQTKSGNLIVIDGGSDADADRLRSQIKSMGGHVSAWLVTHPHSDHVGALNKLMQENANGITIDAIYCSLASPEWYSTYDPSAAEMAHTFISTVSKYPQNKIRSVSKGDMYQVDEVTIQVLNDRYELVNADNHYTGNNAGIVYLLTVNGQRILILGDMCYEGGQRLLEDVGAPSLKADIVQMAHHGQQGVSEEVYQAIQPSICLWPTPTWLWNGDESQYATQTTKRWMSALGVQRHYVMKDGNQTIY